MITKSDLYGLTACLVIITIICTFASAATDANQRIQIDTNQTDNSVIITNFAFEPHELNVTVNSSVSWTNEDTVPHTIVTDKDAAAEIKSANLNKGDTFEYNFTKIGTYPYHCSIHPSMTGVIQVTP